MVCKGSTKYQCLYSTAITLQTLGTLLPLDCLCACTVKLILYYHYAPQKLCIASEPVQ